MNAIQDIRQELRALHVRRKDTFFMCVLLVALLAFIDWRWFDVSHRWPLFASAAVLFVLWVVRWEVLTPLYRSWMFVGLLLGWIVLRLLLILLFYLVLTPMGLVMRLWGKDPLERAIDANAKSYWSYVPEKTDRRRYQKKF